MFLWERNCTLVQHGLTVCLMDVFMLTYFKNKRAQKIFKDSLQIEGDDKAEIECLLKVIKLNPQHISALYNLGLIYKYQLQWKQSLKYNRMVYVLDPTHEEARWNMAIAATALHQWDIARKAWIDNGIEHINDSGPVTANCGRSPIRLNPSGEGEVVWGTRIDPARTQIENIPFKKSGYRYMESIINYAV